MKSYLPILLILLFVCLSRQQVSFTSVYNEFDRVRARFCLSPIVRSATLESQALTAANNFCSGTLPTSKYAALTVGSGGNLTQVTLLSFSNTSFYNSFNAWNCATDLPVAGQTNTSFARHVLLAAQSVGCSYNSPLPCGGVLTTTNYFRMVCLFDQPAYTNVRVFPSSNCACTTAPTTAAPTTVAPTTVAPTTVAPTTVAPTTVAPTTVAPTTVAPTTAAPTTRAPTTAAPTTAAPTTAAPTTAAPTTAAPTTAAPTTAAPTTAAPTTVAPSTTPVPTQSPGVPLYQAVNPTPTATVNEWLKIHHTARDCVGLPRLTWDESLAQDALNWARQGMANSSNSNGACTMFHSQSNTFPARVGQGENINYVGWSTTGSFTFNEVTFITNAVEGWYSEYLNYTCSSNTCSINSNVIYQHTLSTGMKLNLNTCGHYTQLIWRNTTKVGCAYAKCNNDPAGQYKYYGACRYSPQGNYVGVNPLAPTVNCGPFCTRAGGRSLSTQTTVNNPTPVAKTNTSSFFKSESEIYVLALSVFILVVVVSIFVIVLINFVKNRNSNDDYQLLETK